MENAPITDLLERLGAVVRAERRRVATALELKPVQLDALIYLAKANRYSDTPAALTEWLESTKGTVSQTIGVLERKGLLIKRDDPDDGRKVHLELTREGRKAATAGDSNRLLERALAERRASDVLAGELTGLLRDLQRRRGSRSFGVCRTCRYFRGEGSRFRCGLTGEPLTVKDSEKICREHDPA